MAELNDLLVRGPTSFIGTTYYKGNEIATKADITSATGGSSKLLFNSETSSSATGGLTWFDVDGVAGQGVDVNDTPTTAWWHVVRCRHSNTANNYYTDVAIPFNANSMYYKRINGGKLVNSGWVRMLDALNYSSYALPLSGGTMTGNLTLKGSQYNREGALNCNNSDIIGINSLYTSDLADNTAEGLRFKRNQGNPWDTLTACNGTLYFMPNDPDDGTVFDNCYTVIHSGNAAYKVRDSNDTENITITYGKSGQSTTSWLASWNGHELGRISPSTLMKDVIGIWIE